MPAAIAPVASVGPPAGGVAHAWIAVAILTATGIVTIASAPVLSRFIDHPRVRRRSSSARPAGLDTLDASLRPAVAPSSIGRRPPDVGRTADTVFPHI